eukprot:Nk52_evm88s270 gene=Nk52_evmTU88s270
MGICQSAEEKALAEQNKDIEKQLKKDRQEANRTVKLLLLGAGDCGKSTLVKQMKIIHGDGYQQNELNSFKRLIFDNILSSMRNVIQAMSDLGVKYGDEAACKPEIDRILAAPEPYQGNTLPPELGKAVKVLFADAGITQCIARSHEYQLNDSAVYYFEAIDRIAANGYVPTEQDVLRSRVSTTGIVETKFKLGQLVYRMFDVGGQRSERRKWIQCFDDATAIIFVTSLSGYNQVLFEDSETNRMHESLKLFDSIINNRFFAETSIILFLNKIDLFEQKILNHSLKICFPEYNGPDGVSKPAKDYILQKFMERNRNPQKKQIYSHFTCATDTHNITIIFRAVNDIIIQLNLKALGLI